MEKHLAELKVDSVFVDALSGETLGLKPTGPFQVNEKGNRCICRR